MPKKKVTREEALALSAKYRALAKDIARQEREHFRKVETRAKIILGAGTLNLMNTGDTEAKAWYRRIVNGLSDRDRKAIDDWTTLKAQRDKGGSGDGLKDGLKGGIATGGTVGGDSSLAVRSDREGLAPTASAVPPGNGFGEPPVL